MIELTQSQVGRLKQIELDILKEFALVCEKLNIKYYALGGTLIGAVRHGGFIPWDDDVDVGLMREDYEKFLREGQALLPDYLFIQTHQTDEEYLYNFAKIRDSRTTYIEVAAMTRKINHGVFIDIFPIDFYPDEQKLIDKYNSRRGILGNRIGWEYSPKLKRSFKSKVKGVLSKILIPSAEKAYDELQSFMLAAKKGEKVINYCGVYGDREIVPLAYFGEGVLLKFEDMMLSCPENYDGYLKNVYGDYMKLPPEEKRIGHHFACTADFDKPYTEYENLIRK